MALTPDAQRHLAALRSASDPRSEPVIDADLDRAHRLPDSGLAAVREAHQAGAEAHVVVFGLGGPVLSQSVFGADTQCPTRSAVAAGCGSDGITGGQGS